jgi:hypothetical protein
MAFLAFTLVSRAELVDLVETSQLAGSDTVAGDHFGTALAVSGDTLVAGAPDKPGGGGAYVFVRAGSDWVEQAALVAPDGANGDGLGEAAAIFGDTIVVGAPGDFTSGGLRTGSAYVFVRNGTSWSFQAKFVPAAGGSFDEYGATVSISGETLVIGARLDDTSGSDAGAAYIYTRSGTIWTLETMLLAPDGLPMDRFGRAVAVDGDTALISAPRDDTTGGVNAGSVYVFLRTGGVWGLQQKLTTSSGNSFGAALDLEGDRAVILTGTPAVSTACGASYTRSGTAWTFEATIRGWEGACDNAIDLQGDRVLVGAAAGGAYLWQFNGSSWSGLDFGTVSGSKVNDLVGRAVALAGEQALLGAPGNFGSSAGAAYLFDLATPPNSTVPESEIVGPDFSRFGESLDRSSDTLIVGAPRDSGDIQEGGAVHVFVTGGGSGWVQQARLVADTPRNGAEVGEVVALDGDTLVAGAPAESVVGSRSGAAYVFARTGTVWSSEGQLLPDNGGALDGFGGAVAVEGDMIAVGAQLGDDAITNTGAVYIFVRSGSAWSLQQRVVPVGAEALDLFGAQVVFDGDRLLASAPGDDDSGFRSGAIYVFARTGTTWSEQDKLVPNDAVAEDQVGHVLRLDGDRLLVSSGFTTSSPSHAFDAVYVYSRSGTTWTQGDRIEITGDSLEFDGDLLSYGHAGLGPAGMAWTLRWDGDDWTPDKELAVCGLPSNAGFGTSVSVFGEHVLVSSSNTITENRVFVYDLEPDSPSFCDGSDGALASCPCGNAGNPDAGCDIAQGTGGVALVAVAQQTSPENRATLSSSGYAVMGNPTAVLLRSPGLDASSPVVFGDGVRCIGVPVVRLGVTFANNGVATSPLGHGAMAGPGAFYYQLWLRNNPAMFCTPESFNMSQGRVLTW